MQHDEIFLTLPENLPAATTEIDKAAGMIKEEQAEEAEPEQDSDSETVPESSLTAAAEEAEEAKEAEQVAQRG